MGEDCLGSALKDQNHQNAKRHMAKPIAKSGHFLIRIDSTIPPPPLDGKGFFGYIVGVWVRQVIAPIVIGEESPDTLAGANRHVARAVNDGQEYVGASLLSLGKVPQRLY